MQCSGALLGTTHFSSGDGGRLRVLAVTRIFPNRVEPLACPFQRRQLAALSRLADVQVLGVVPWVPGASLMGDRARVGKLCRVPAEDTIDGLHVVHPRAPYLPLAGPWLSAVNGPLYLAGLVPHLAALRRRFDVVLGAFLFPDAWAARHLARALGLPYAVKAHGTDVNVIARWPSVRALVHATLQRAGVVIGVSRPMLEALAALGAPRDRVTLVPNGVDRALFQPRSRGEARAALGLDARSKVLVYVGRLEPEKGLHELCDALASIEARAPKQFTVALVGDGSMRKTLEEKRDAGLPLVVTGARPAEEVARFLAASDALVLPSWNEGTPNVVLEALAAGRPVVATRVGGIPDVVSHERTGLLVPARDTAALARAIEQATSRSWDEDELTRAAPPGWDRSAEALLAALERARSVHA
ncbi:glycosyltransferase family 4 protein [Polyangium sp. y55x31]|uniref:glycosyltransferase family 4 protein n=1 Tax=Polyangium sp. y55x31 TaxID=3042688 RepID=UPI0024822400|nr:glycosyltransferase family 4 protein [Polyangium sp. y55x31]MDI1478972.1 glycosyltransferase family 4 protein [Polyangium sp. y55x31]